MYEKMHILTALLSLSQVLIIVEAENYPGISDDVGLNITEYVPKYGYPFECHDVTTEDGYIITIHRIPHGRNENGKMAKDRPAVLIMHGLLSSSMDFVNSGPEKAIGFILADAGYDVWLGNQRGNTWGRKHITLDPVKNAAEFFDFSFEEIAIYDVAAFIDYILNVTGSEKIIYLGHSQGTEVFFALTSLKPEYNDKIQLGIMLAPVAYMSNAEALLFKILNNHLNFIKRVAGAIGLYELLPHYPMITEFGKNFCGDGNKFQYICVDIFAFFSGPVDLLNKTLIPMIASNAPAGVSLKQLIHLAQLYRSGTFRRYNYGFVGNLQRYGKIIPPSFNISQITSPVVLYWADNDFYCRPKDLDRLATELRNVKRVHVNNTSFAHLDYLWSRNINDMIINNIMEVIKENTHSNRRK